MTVSPSATKHQTVEAFVRDEGLDDGVGPGVCTLKDGILKLEADAEIDVTAAVRIMLENEAPTYTDSARRAVRQRDGRIDVAASAATRSGEESRLY